jgi:hypothetical protein
MTKRQITLRTVRAVVDAFGGTKDLAEWAGHGESAISNWLARGFIPPGWHYRISEELKKKDLEAAPEVFGQRPRSPIPDPKSRAEARVA